jgi:hypothetical protein
MSRRTPRQRKLLLVALGVSVLVYAVGLCSGRFLGHVILIPFIPLIGWLMYLLGPSEGNK